MYKQNVPLLRIFFQCFSGLFFTSPLFPSSLSLCRGMPQRPSHLWVITFSRFRLDGWKSLCFTGGWSRGCAFLSETFAASNLRHVLLPGLGYLAFFFFFFLHQGPFYETQRTEFLCSFFRLFSPTRLLLLFFFLIFAQPRNSSVEIRSMCAWSLSEFM